MDVLNVVSIALVGIAAGYGVLSLASKSKGILVPLGYVLGTMVLVGSFFTASVCTSKCFSMYQKQCPVSESWSHKSAAVSETTKPSSGV